MRPTHLLHNGWKEDISSHDAYYASERSKWKARIKASHPDSLWVRLPPPTSRLWSYDLCQCGNPKKRVAHCCQPCLYSGRSGATRWRSGPRFRATLAAFKVWKASEAEWYRARGLTPPDPRDYRPQDTSKNNSSPSGILIQSPPLTER